MDGLDRPSSTTAAWERCGPRLVHTPLLQKVVFLVLRGTLETVCVLNTVIMIVGTQPWQYGGDVRLVFLFLCAHTRIPQFHFVQQMNGAELPDGSVLQVEPAESNQSVKKDTNMSMMYGVNNNQSKGGSLAEENEVVKDLVSPSDQVPPATKSEEGNDENDLDDFFASLS